MCKFCINCGAKGSLVVLTLPEDYSTPFLEMGYFDGEKYSAEQELVPLNCKECDHIMFHLGASIDFDIAPLNA